ncbi:4-hydroxythreonine-4-phosphate dehydrogenase PdxA [Puniceicoccaceae bacterium K14]|nr:4-hydroxythreonine-4-phosphate dehydrogenase PdxA [Puniceicoccaceae bacterium K14]
MSSERQLPIAITCGDPASVSLEIIVECLSKPLETGSPFAVIGPQSWLDALRWHESNHVERIPVGNPDYLPKPGVPCDEGARLAIEAMEIAAQGCVDGRFSAVATGPISKENCKAVGYRYPGQTEFFAAKWGGEPSMGFAGEQLNVVLATWHIPVSEVPSAVTEESISLAVRRANLLGQLVGVDAPRIAVCGLNPHAGENGILGTEERDSIDPLLDKLRKDFPGLSPCLPGDTVFARAMKGEFDVVVAMYHDQGLAPMKAVEFDSAVNVTLGLSFVRTSPDHGTAFSIAGKGLASASSFRRAIRLAANFSSRSVPTSR